MLKIANLLEKAKMDPMVKKSGTITIYRFKGENKLRYDSIKIERKDTEYVVIEMIAILERSEAGDFRVTRYSEEGQKLAYLQALKEADKDLYYGIFAPELDNLVKKSVADIMFKVVTERDLLEEGELEYANDKWLSDRVKNSWRKKVNNFFRRYEDLIEPDQLDEKKIYQEYK